MKYFINNEEVSKNDFENHLQKDVILENSSTFNDYDECDDDPDDLRAVDEFLREQGLTNSSTDVSILKEILQEEKMIIVNDNVYAINKEEN